ncbi:MAG: DUF523 domain-containing protein [Campylobacterales bacterium]
MPLRWKNKKTTEVLDAFDGWEIIPFCPEAPLFGTPRQRISVVEVDGLNKIITDETKEDATKLLKDEIESFLDKHQNVDSIVLKSKSPSCGIGTTPVLDTNKNILRYANGIAGDIFSKRFKDIDMKIIFH